MRMALKACNSPESVNQKNCTCKVKIKYPCQWLYKVIGSDQGQLRLAVAEIIRHECDISFSNRSSKGKYLCLNLELTVQSEEERNSIYTALKEHPSIKIVL